ncbi:MAG: ABC transporter permease, partial [Chloroflexi bacterium]|nr:ABC transporter permease [Chloroflexota bacterium]
MWQRIWAVMQKEFIQTLRDRRTLAIQLAIPIVQLFLLGYAITMNVENIPTAVADQSLDNASREFVAAMTASGFFDIAAYVPDERAVLQMLDAGEARAGIVIPPGFGADVQRREAHVLLLVDGSDLFTSQSAYNAINAIAQNHATEILMQSARRAGALISEESLLPLDTRFRILYNPDLNDLIFLIPSMVAMLLQTQTISLTAAAVVREREVGTIEQLLVTPIRPGELMIGKTAPNIFISLINVLTIVALGVVWFGVPFQGNFWLFLALSFIYVFTGLGLGLLLSTISQNQKQAQQLAAMMMLVGLVLGGFIFPRESMPPVIRLIGNLFPLTYFIPISRGIITKGAGLELLWEELLALLL